VNYFCVRKGVRQPRFSERLSPQLWVGPVSEDWGPDLHILHSARFPFGQLDTGLSRSPCLAHRGSPNRTLRRIYPSAVPCTTCTVRRLVRRFPCS
jgi:hypothetical protein